VGAWGRGAAAGRRRRPLRAVGRRAPLPARSALLSGGGMARGGGREQVGSRPLTGDSTSPSPSPLLLRWRRPSPAPPAGVRPFVPGLPSAPPPPPHPPPWRAQARRRPALGQGSGSGTRPLPCSRASSLPHARSAARPAGGCAAPPSMGSLVRRRRGEQGTARSSIDGLLRPRPTPYRPLLLDGLAAGVANRARIGSGDGGGGLLGDGELQKGSGDAAGAKDDSELEVVGGDWRRLELQLHAPSAPSAGGGRGAAVLPRPPVAVELQPRRGAAGGPPSGRRAASPTWREVVGATTSGRGGPSRSPLHSSGSKGTGAQRDFGVVPAVVRCGALSGIRPRHADRGIFPGPRCG
jgi:hypothetical protein